MSAAYATSTTTDDRFSSAREKDREDVRSGLGGVARNFMNATKVMLPRGRARAPRRRALQAARWRLRRER